MNVKNWYFIFWSNYVTIYVKTEGKIRINYLNRLFKKKYSILCKKETIKSSKFSTDNIKIIKTMFEYRRTMNWHLNANAILGNVRKNTIFIYNKMISVLMSVWVLWLCFGKFYMSHCVYKLYLKANMLISTKMFIF